MLLIHTQKELADFLQKKLNLNDFSLTSLKEEASNRNYFRLHFSGSSSLADGIFQKEKIKQCVISVNHRTIDVSDDFLTIQNEFIKNRIQVPEIYRVDQKEGLIWQEDIGEKDLKEHVQNTFSQTDSIEDYYAQSVQYLVRLKHMKPSVPIQTRFFDYTKLFDELSFLEENAAKHVHGKYPGLEEFNFEQGIKEEWKNLCRELDAFKDERICHRDFHSANIIIKDGRAYLIDFQDARMGSRYYDLASLLYDPYTNLDDEFREKLFLYYHKQTKEAPNRSVFEKQAAQRLLKALGTYIHQLYEKENVKYGTFILPTLEKLQGLLSRMPITAHWVETLSEKLRAG